MLTFVFVILFVNNIKIKNKNKNATFKILLSIFFFLLDSILVIDLCETSI